MSRTPETTDALLNGESAPAPAPTAEGGLDASKPDSGKENTSAEKRLVMTEDLYFITTQKANSMEEQQFLQPDALLALRLKALSLAKLAFGPKSVAALSSDTAVSRALLLTGRLDVAEQRLQAVHTQCIEEVRNLSDQFGGEDWWESSTPPDPTAHGADRVVLWSTRKQYESLLEEVIFLMAAVCVIRVKDLAAAALEETKQSQKDATQRPSAGPSSSTIEQAVAYAKAAQARLTPLVELHEKELERLSAPDKECDEFESAARLRSLTVLITVARLQLWLHSQRGRPGHHSVLETAARLQQLLEEYHVMSIIYGGSSTAPKKPPLVLDQHLLTARVHLALIRELEKKEQESPIAEVEEHLLQVLERTTQALQSTAESQYEAMELLQDFLPACELMFPQDDASINRVTRRLITPSLAMELLAGSANRPDVALLRVIGEVCKVRAQAHLRLARTRGKVLAQERERYTDDYSRAEFDTQIVHVHNPVAGKAEPSAKVMALQALDCWSAARAILTIAYAALSASPRQVKQIFEKNGGESASMPQVTSDDDSLPSAASIVTAGAWDPGLPGATWTILNIGSCAQMMNELKQDIHICDVYIIELLLALGPSAHPIVVQTAEALIVAAEDEDGCAHTPNVASAIERLADINTAIGEPEKAKRAFVAAMLIHSSLRSADGSPQDQYHAKAINSIQDALRALPGGEASIEQFYALADDRATSKSLRSARPAHPKTPKLTPETRLADAISRLSIAQTSSVTSGTTDVHPHQSTATGSSNASHVGNDAISTSGRPVTPTNTIPAHSNASEVISPLDFGAVRDDAKQDSSLTDDIFLSDDQTQVLTTQGVSVAVAPPLQQSSGSPKMSVSSRRKLSADQSVESTDHASPSHQLESHAALELAESVQDGHLDDDIVIE